MPEIDYKKVPISQGGAGPETFKGKLAAFLDEPVLAGRG